MEVIFKVAALAALALLIFAQIAVGIWVRKYYGARANMLTGLGMAAVAFLGLLLLFAWNYFR